MMMQTRENWVFGYGSLMWNPGFPYIRAEQAEMHGVHRTLCVYSWVHRGTQAHPGLVLGLDEGGSCHGMAFQVADADWEAVLTYLREREQVTQVYLERVRPVFLQESQREVETCTFLVDHAHEQYAGALSLDDQFARVVDAVGQSGPNPDYVLNTVAHLDEMGLRDDELHALADRLRAVQA